MLAPRCSCDCRGSIKTQKAVRRLMLQLCWGLRFNQ